METIDVEIPYELSKNIHKNITGKTFDEKVTKCIKVGYAVAFEKCVGCGTKVHGVPHTICANCGAAFCSTCTYKTWMDQCPKCGYKGT